ncbi:sulphate transporter [Xylanimonas cellulosilytica DSM 15894]|uniref:Sulphate transporter n=1 Tax=Xylanimonas cellulosilytica (strain DSM 15894 / JCM 12276 / CECT 5975 / KCTC 9989 / LMG 20990 / NBRC 107835 / XIL07) TaxID=446471 RepID=D1BU18_XYLCX|nr:SulP family inorganic anion transporter [Xylanimonas cellulosilytica]ACZ29182.1 sulphate transporter [Xylanimonas cellulosilytica DSM 15894]
MPTPHTVSVRAVLRSPRLLRIEILAGLVTAFALIPEATAFSIVLGVDPRLGLFSSFVGAVAIALLGGRPAMVSAAAGSVALVAVPLVREHGADYLIVAVVLSGLLQVVLGVAGVARLMRFIPRSVMVGFVNGLAILIFWSQVRHLVGVPWAVYPLVAAGIAVVVLFPRVTKAVPAPLVAIVALTVVAVAGGLDVPTVGDEGALPQSLPSLLIPDVPLTLDTLRIVAPYVAGMALVGLLESLLTAKLVDDVTDTRSDKSREAWGLGVTNVLAGLFGGQGVCAMIGQTVINVRGAGARSRVSTFMAGVFVLVLVVGLNDVVAQIPMAALVAVMIMVAVMTFDWHSVRPATLRRMPRSETTVMVATVVVTVATDNLAVGVLVGVVVAMVMFARRVAHFTSVTPMDDVAAVGPGLTSDADDGAPRRRTYVVEGELFFASSNDLVYQFDYADDPDDVVVDLTRAHVWDASTVATLDAIQTKYAARGKRVTIVGANPDTAARLTRLSTLTPGG